VYKSTITGYVGASPNIVAAILLKYDEVKGTIFSIDAYGPPCKITDATRILQQLVTWKQPTLLLQVTLIQIS
jgi:hypothetical protein